MAGEPYAPAASTTVSARTPISSPSRRSQHLDDGSVGDDPVAERTIEDRQVGAAAGGIDVRERRVDPDAAFDVDWLDPESDATVEVVEVIGSRQPEHRSRLEAGTVERPDFVLCIRSNLEGLQGAGERGSDGVGAPARVAGRRCPRVVVGRATDRHNAAVVRGAASDHPGARERNRFAPGDHATRVAPVVRGDKSTAVEEIRRPEP